MVFPLGNEFSPAIRSWITWLLILANLAGFGLEQFRPFSFLIAYSATPYEITHNTDITRPFPDLTEPADSPVDQVWIHQATGPRPIQWTILTSLFLHADLFHLAGNLLFLFVFGRRVEEAMGRLPFLVFYLVCGGVGTLTQVAAVPDSLTPILGASGAVAGVMGAYLVWFPRDRVRVLVVNVLVLVPASAVIGCWIAAQLVHTYFLLGAVSRSGSVAYLAHLGGSATGLIGALVLSSRWFKPGRSGGGLLVQGSSAADDAI